MRRKYSWQNEDLTFEDEDSFDWKKYAPYGVVALILIIILVIILIVVANRKPKGDAISSENTQGTEVSQMSEETSEVDDDVLIETESVDASQEDPQNAGMYLNEESGAAVEVSSVIKGSAENENITVGIDVAKYQGKVNWSTVAASGIDFAMVRVGYRTTKTGEINIDPYAKYNLKEAAKNGIKVGAYFFSSAISTAEAVEEANWVISLINKYNITYPVAYDCENFDSSDSRQYHMSNQTRTEVAMAFMDRIAQAGYTPMFYGSANALKNNAKWDTSTLEKKYKIWVAQYPGSPYPETSQTSYPGIYSVWQYTNKGTIPGVNGEVDINLAYFGYSQVADKKSDEEEENVTIDVEAGMNFSSVNETVTAKDEVNLRSIPSQGGDCRIIYTLKNGETALRTGTSSKGWSRLEYNGQKCYAVSSYLTTDLSYKPAWKQENNVATEQKPVDKNPEETKPQGPDQSTGGETKPETSQGEQPIATVNGLDFYAVSDTVTPKEATNLRSAPLAGDEYIVVQVENGTALTRLAYTNKADANGWYWSKVSYNGQELYCLTTLITTYKGL